MSYREDGLARHLPDEEMLKREPVPEPVKRGPKEQTIVLRNRGSLTPGMESEKPALHPSETSGYPLEDLTLEAFQSQADPQKKHELLVAMITELGNGEHTKVVMDKLLKTVVTILQDVREPSEENAILVQARARRAGVVDPMGELINALPKAYRATVDTSYMNARFNAEVVNYKRTKQKSDKRISSEKTVVITPRANLNKTNVAKPNVGEHVIKTPPPLEQESSAHFE